MTDVVDTAHDEYVRAATEGMARDDNAAYVALDTLGVTLLAEFAQAVLDRRETEQRWLMDLRQYRGLYDPDVEAKFGKNRSRAFVRLTRVKVKTANARVADLLFPTTSDRNWTAEPTAVPSVDRDTRRKLISQMVAKTGAVPTRRELDAAVAKLVKMAADKMTSIMDDQLAEAQYKSTARDVLHSGHLYGTGVLKAPLVERKTRQKFVRVNGNWVMKTESYIVPFVAYVPLWRFYPDMSATKLSDCGYVFEQHIMTRGALAALAKRKAFNGAKIRAYILANPKGAQTSRAYDNEIRQIGERQSAKLNHDGNYEVVERWGWIGGELLSQAGVVVPQDRMHETFFSNVWMLPDGDVIKITLQPINGVTYPYHLYYADKDETSIFGDGFASIMRDDQTTVNAATRMVLDNAALSAGPQIEVNMNLLSPAEDADDMYPFKIWKRAGQDASQPAIRVLNVPNGLEELLPIVEMFKKNADDVTAIPRYMQGENATQGAAGTASGMSMLMANASIVMKDLITNYDEGVTRPFISDLYKWNMQFNPDNSCKGDFDIKARGTASLMAKEVRAQQLDNFAATLTPEDAPYIKREELLRQRAEAHDLSSIIKTEDEVEAERNNDAAQAAAAQQQQMQELQMKVAMLGAEKITQEVAKLAAEVTRINAIATKTNVDAAYAGMQAAGVATERPEIAPAGDAILKSAGWVDSTPGQPTPAGSAPPGAAQPAIPDPQQLAAQRDPRGGQVGANVGEHAGIETAAIE
ncbi:hypothetical protein [Massilia sp. CCM 8734]|uniref:portal protein n=1 Tax=Massilia sp. CCM 8734 TaxID=2609283 RepID=UPI0014240B85|nr:hypothetical protein [Massilia sp. CCM 8734]NIA00910.1 hypothetical protein [Massilia sp. CCM 8734]